MAIVRLLFVRFWWHWDMTTVVRNSSRWNDIRVIYFGEGNYRKGRFMKGKTLHSEASGILWYYSNSFDESKVRFGCSDQYARLDFHLWKRKLDYGQPFSKIFVFWVGTLSPHKHLARFVLSHVMETLPWIIFWFTQTVLFSWIGNIFKLTGSVGVLIFVICVCQWFVCRFCKGMHWSRRLDFVHKILRRLGDLGIKELIRTPFCYFKNVFKSNLTWQEITLMLQIKCIP